MKKAKKLLSLVCALAIMLTAIPTFNNTCVNALTTNGLVEDSGFEAGELITKFDPTNSITSGWTLHSYSSIQNSPEGDGTKVVRLDNNRGDHNYADISTGFESDNFIVVAVIGSDSNSTYADGIPYIAVKDTDAEGNVVSTEMFGFSQKNRGESKSPRPGKYFYKKQGSSTYYQPYDVTFDDDGYTKITLTVYRYNGTYYYYANGSLICEYTTTGEQTGSISLCIADTYSFAYVHSAAVYKIKPPKSNDGLVEDSGFEVGEKIAELDPTNSLTDGWVLHDNSVITNSPENDGTKVVRLDNNRGDHNYADISTGFESDNFIVVAVIGSDSNSTYADGTPYIAVKDTDAEGNVVSTEMFGFSQKNRGESKTPSPGKYFYKKQDSSTYYQPYDVTFDDDGYTKITLTVYRYNGTYYYYANGSLICEYTTTGEQTGNISLCIADSYSFAYVHSATVYEIESSANEPQKSTDGLFADSGFITGDVIESIDFSEMNTGSITESGNWTFTKASVKKAPEGSSNALYFDNNYGKATANVNLSKKNFVAVAVFGTTSDTNADGFFSLEVIGLTKANENATALSTSFSQINRTNNPSNGKTMVVDGGYTYGSAVTFDEDGYTLVTVTMYAYDDVYYCYCNGMFLGTYVNRKGVSTDEVCALSVSNSWSYGYLHSVTVYDIVPADFTVSGASYVNGEKSGLNVALTLDQSKNNGLDMSGAEYGAVVTLKNGSTPENTTVETAGAKVEKFNPTNENIVKFNCFAEATDNQFVNVRPYILVNGTYYYSEAKIYSVKAISAVTKGEDTKKITFTAFSDFHYMKNQETGVICRSDVSDLVSILERAEQTGSAFVMHGGDFTKDAKVSSEIFETYHNYKKENGEIMSVYGIYGNHDLEQGNKMTTVNPTLTNDTNTVWGTESGKMEVDSRIAYYYVDYDNFRFIYLDDMYSYNPTEDIWERNYDGSYSYPSGNTKGYSLGPVQMAWLKEVLTDAGKNDMTCVVTTHAAKHDKLASATGGDRAELLELYKTINNTYPSTVVLCLNGHTHGDEIVEADGIVWMDINNTFANTQTSESLVPETGMYSDDMTVRKEIYDNDGNFLRYEDVALNTLQFKDSTYFAEDPLSAVITIDENGVILIDGTDSQWVYGLEPSKDCLKGLGYLYGNSRKPRISSYSNINCEVTGHIFVNSDECASCHKYIAKQTEGFDYDYIKIAESVVDNETYSVKIKYKSNADKAISFLTADNDIVFRNAGYIGAFGKDIITLKQSDTVIEAEAFITIDKFTSGGVAQGDALYLYLSDADGLEIENITLTKLSAEYGGALIKNKGVSILKDVAENEEQALRFYFSYETSDGTQLLINNKAYTVKSRGFLIANANKTGDSAVTRDTAKQTENKIVDINIDKNLNNCWQGVKNTETNYDIWYSVHITGFKPVDNTYNNEDKVYAKGYVVIADEFGNEFTLYSKESVCTVKDIAILN